VRKSVVASVVADADSKLGKVEHEHTAVMYFVRKILNIKFSIGEFQIFLKMPEMTELRRNLQRIVVGERRPVGRGRRLGLVEHCRTGEQLLVAVVVGVAQRPALERVRAVAPVAVPVVVVALGLAEPRRLAGPALVPEPVGLLRVGVVAVVAQRVAVAGAAGPVDKNSAKKVSIGALLVSFRCFRRYVVLIF
jgi:hypothetical protein